MNKAIYLRRMKPSRYDGKRVLVYLGETVIDNYLPEDAPEGAEPRTAYQYEGELPDGGTLIEADEFSRDKMVNGVIRARYSQTEEDAIKTHQIILIKDPSHPKAEEWAAEWAEFCSIRESAIALVDTWLAD